MFTKNSKMVQYGPNSSKIISQITAVGATAVGVTAVRNNLKGLFTYYVSQKWGGPDPPSPLVSQKNQKLAYPPCLPCQKKSEIG